MQAWSGPSAAAGFDLGSCSAADNGGTPLDLNPHPRRLVQRFEAESAIDALLGGIKRGAGGTMVLVGGPGLGKTSLLERAQTRAGDGITVQRAGGHAMEADLPFGLLTQVLEPLGGAPLADAGRDADPAGARAEVWRRAQRWIEAAAARQPLLLLLDDLHWSDPDSLRLWAFLARRIEDLSVGMIATTRPWPTPADEMARQMAAQRSASRLELQPLTEAGAATLLEDLVGHEAEPGVVKECWRLSQGNPMLVEHLSRMLQTEGALPDRDRFERGRFGGVLLLWSFSWLPEEAIAYAGAAAILGAEFRLVLVAPVAALGAADADEALDVLVRAGLVGLTRPGWAAFTHALVAQAIEDDLAPGARARLHRRAFARLAELGEDGSATRHAVAADLVDDPAALATARAAARRSLARGAVFTAVEQLDAAVALSGRASGPLLLQRGEALLACGRVQDAVVTCRIGLDDAHLSGQERAAGLRLLARALAYAGDLDAAASTGGEAVLHARSTFDDKAEAAALVEQAHAVWQCQGPRAAWALLRRDRADPFGQGPHDLRAGSCLVGYFAEADASTLEAMVPLLPAAGPADLDQTSPFDPMLAFLTVARLVERFDEHDRVLELATTSARSNGLVHATLALGLSRFDGMLRRGRLAEAAALLEELDARGTDEVLLVEVFALARAGLLCETGQISEAAALLAGTPPSPMMWMSRLSRAHLDGRVLLEAHRWAEASDAYLRTEALADELGVVEPSQVAWAAHAIDAHVGARRLDHAERVCAGVEALLGRLPISWVRMVAPAGRAAIAAATGDADTAHQRYAEAAAVASPLTLARARVRFAQGRWLRRSGQPVLARAPLAEALNLAEGAGAIGLAAAAEGELRVAGGRRRPERRWDELTAQQARVEELARQGRTTEEMAQILSVSVKTVESHLTQVYRKLGVLSKRALRRRP